MRPIGSNDDGALTLSREAPSEALKGQIVAVLHAPHTPDDDTSAAEDEIPPSLIACNTGGFLNIVGIDVDQDYLECLAPCPTSFDTLPSKYLMVGNIQYND